MRPNGEITEKTHVFINAYFDLIEIHRRELMNDIIKAEKDKSTIQELYYNRMEIVFAESEKFFNQVNKGENTNNMGKWNAYIWKKLHINNIEIFSPDIEIEDAENE